MTKSIGAMFVVWCLVNGPQAWAQTPTAAVEPTVTVSGEGIVRAAPDRAWVTISAESRASNPREAQRRNTEVMTPVQAKLTGAGLGPGAIRTVGYDLQQEWDFVNGKRVPRGYVARNSIEVRVDDIVRLGEMLETAVGSGATSVGGIRFDVADRGTLEREALRLAVSDARMKANVAAAAAGRTIDRILRIDEQGVPAPPSPIRMMREASLAGAVPVDVPIVAGELEIRAGVTVTAVLK